MLDETPSELNNVITEMEEENYTTSPRVSPATQRRKHLERKGAFTTSQRTKQSQRKAAYEH